MSESSLPPIGPARFRLFLKTFGLGASLRGVLGRLHPGRRRDAGSAPEADLELRAARVLREYLDAHAANLDRAVRLGEKAERLEKAGIPSDSARNRAERAREEVMEGIAVLRSSFVEAAGERKGRRAFDRALEDTCPVFAPPRPGFHSP